MDALKSRFHGLAFLVVTLAAACGGGGGGTSGTGGTSGSTGGSSTTGTHLTTSGSTGHTVTTTTTTGTATGTASGTSTGTGGLCAEQSSPCQPAATCAGANCCCSGLLCNQDNQKCDLASTSATGGDAGACTPGAAGAACTTLMDCASGMDCETFSDGGTYCETAPSPGLGCIGNDTSLAPGKPCCESVIDAGGVAECGTYQACTETGFACDSSSDCCTEDAFGATLACQKDGGVGTCGPTCGTQTAACTTNADCCTGQGYTCIDPATYGITGFTGNICLQLALQTAQGTLESCAGTQLCSANPGSDGQVECQLGASCSTDAGDPCAAAGLVCDLSADVCRNPDLLDQCVPGGPGCNPSFNSTTTTECLSGLFTVPLCVQPCTSSGDCDDPQTQCFTSGGKDACAPGVTPCTKFFQLCNAQGTNDGVCAPVNGGTDPSFPSLCNQAALDGGGSGTLCDVSGSRQNGGMCDTKDFCDPGGLCEPICNAGTADAGLAACGAGQACLFAFNGTYGGFGGTPGVDPDVFGECVTTCSIAAADGGGCSTSQAGVAEKCIPSELFGFAPGQEPDFCGAANPTAQQVAVGESCGGASVSSWIDDPCVPGALCLGASDGNGSVCTQLCADSQIGQSGAAGGCAAGETCTGLSFTGTASTHVGYCSGTVIAGTTSTGTTGTATGTTGASTGTTTGGSTTGTTSTGTGTGTSSGSTSAASSSSSTGTSSSGTTGGGL